MKPLMQQLLLPLWAVFAVSAFTSGGLADDATLSAGRAEMEKAVQSLRPRPSLDTTLVEFSVGGAYFKMPRNYLTKMPNRSGGAQPLVTVTVNLPDLKPLSSETLPCFTSNRTSRQTGCEPFSFDIEADGPVSAEQVFANIRRLFHNQTPINGPFGYEEYVLGPGREFYRKIEGDRTLMYDCQIFDNHGKRDGICMPDGDRLPSGGILHFFFNLRQLSDIAEIDSSIRKLIERFAVQPGDNK